MCTSSTPTSICAKISTGNQTLIVHFATPVVLKCLKSFIDLKRDEGLDFGSIKSALEKRFSGCTFPDTPPSGIEVDLF